MSYELTITTNGTSDSDAESLAATVEETLATNQALLDRWSSWYQESYEMIDGGSTTEHLEARAYLNWGADLSAAVDDLAAALSDQSWLRIETRTVYYEYRDDEIASDPTHYPPTMATGLRTDPSASECGDCGIEIGATDYRIAGSNYSSDTTEIKLDPIKNWRRVVIYADDTGSVVSVESDPAPNTDALSDPSTPADTVTLATATVPPEERPVRRLEATSQYQQHEPTDAQIAYEHGTIPEDI